MFIKILIGFLLVGVTVVISHHKVVGPAYDEVAKRYAGKGSAEVDKLAEKVIKGGSGNWGTVPMTPHPALSADSAKEMVRYILSLKNQ